MYFEELNGDFSAGLWRKNPNGRKDIHHGSHGRIEGTPGDDAESSPFTDDFLSFFSKAGDAFTVGFVVVRSCVSFVVVVSAVAVVQLHLKKKNLKDGEEEEEEELLDGCEYGSTIRSRTGARRKKKKRKNDDDSSSSLYGGIV